MSGPEYLCISWYNQKLVVWPMFCRVIHLFLHDVSSSHGKGDLSSLFEHPPLSRQHSCMDCNFTVGNAITKSGCTQHMSTLSFPKLSHWFSSKHVGQTSLRGCRLSLLMSWQGRVSENSSRASLTNIQGTLCTLVIGQFLRLTQSPTMADRWQSPSQFHGQFFRDLVPRALG